MHRRGFIKSIGLIVVVVIVVGVVLYSMIPPNIGWPTESRRLVHPSGFSIIKPLGWEEHVIVNEQGSDYVKLLPANPVGPPGYLTVVKLHTPEDEAKLKAKGFVSTTFQNQPALEMYQAHSLTREMTRNLTFQRDGVWFQIEIRRPVTESVDSGIWPTYLDSFRVEPIRKAPVFSTTMLSITVPSTTAPATAPAP